MRDAPSLFRRVLYGEKAPYHIAISQGEALTGYHEADTLAVHKDRNDVEPA